MTLRTTCKNKAVEVAPRRIGGILPPSTGHSGLGSAKKMFKMGVGAIPGGYNTSNPARQRSRAGHLGNPG